MANSGNQAGFESDDTKLRESSTLMPDKRDAFRPQARYLRFINIARITVAIAASICGLAFALAENRADYLRVRFGEETNKWTGIAILFGICFLASNVAALALVIEYLARPAAMRRFSVLSFVLRFLSISIVAIAIYYAMHKGYGSWQGIGAVASLFLVLAALREHRVMRIKLGFWPYWQSV